MVISSKKKRPHGGLGEDGDEHDGDAGGDRARECRDPYATPSAFAGRGIETECFSVPHALEDVSIYERCPTLGALII
jgi:hypothetical protein